MKNRFLMAAGLLAALLLSACGGGGSGGGAAGTGASSSAVASSVASSSVASSSVSSSSLSSSVASSVSSSAAVTVHLLGDSTMTTYTEDRRPQYGWGEKLGMFFNGSVTIKNWAAGGRSSRSFYYETGKWDAAKAAINTGDYVIIQFGHNDQKYGTDYNEYGTYAYCSDGTGNGESCTGALDAIDSTGTVDKGLHSYYQFLKKYVTEVRAKGGIPILMTPIVRNYWASGAMTAEGQHNVPIKGAETFARGDYPAAMKAIATTYSVPLVDITAGTKTLVESYGATAAGTDLYYPDSTHLNGTYATLVAKMAVDGLKSQNILKDYIISVTSLLASPSTLAWGDRYVGDTSYKSLNVSTFDLSPASGTVTLTAPSGYKLSLDKTTWTGTLDVAYGNGAFTRTVYVQFAPTAVQAYNGNLTVVISGGATLGSVALSGSGIAVPSGVSTYVLWKMNDNALTATTGGLVTGSDAVVSNLTAGSVKALAVDGVTVNVNRYNSTTSTAHDATKYVQFTVTAPASGSFSINTISAWLATSGGANTRADIEYSLNADFSGSVRLNAADLTFTTDVMAKTEYASLAINVPANAKLYLRFFPWYSSTATGKYLAVSDVKISGIVTTSP
ncbi:GDSL-type esterase/lipase family protein [Viridibacterium curvum]